MSEVREIVTETIRRHQASPAAAISNWVFHELTTAGFRILGPDKVGALDRLMARADAWPLNSDSARVSVRLGDLRALGRKA